MSRIASFEIDFLQYLDPEGQPVLPLPEFAQNPEQLLAMYRSIILTRTLDTKTVNLQRMGKMGTYPSSFGQEAVSIGLGFALNPDDVFVPYYRDQGTMLLRGVKISEILRYWGGDERANNYSDPRAKEDFPISIPVGSQVLHAVGIAFAMKYFHQARAAVTTCGDGATSKGDFYEALNFAGVQQLPVVFVINNNQWAISVPRKIQTAAETLAQKAIAAGFTGIQVDGNDVIAVREAISAAITRARNGSGPALIEAVTFRLSDHTTVDDARRYSDPSYAEKARAFEPAKRLKKYLMQLGLWSDTQEQQLQTDCINLVDQAIQEFLAAPRAPLTDMFDYLYADLPDELRAEREEVERRDRAVTLI